MELFENAVVTHINEPITVYSCSGRNVKITNRENYGLSFCTSGQITYTIDGKKIVSNKNNVVFLPKGRSYTLHGDKDGYFPLINFDCLNFNCNTITALPLSNTESCLKDYEKLKSLFLFKETEFEKFSVFYELLNKISKQQSAKSNTVLPIIEYIEKNFSNPMISNTYLADKIGISEIYLRKLFKTQYGITPKQYLIDIRIKKAYQLLTDTDFTVTAISEQCGFTSVYHFCRAFKEKTGFTPTEYAKQFKIYKI